MFSSAPTRERHAEIGGGVGVMVAGVKAAMCVAMMMTLVAIAAARRPMAMVVTMPMLIVQSAGTGRGAGMTGILIHVRSGWDLELAETPMG